MFWIFVQNSKENETFFIQKLNPFVWWWCWCWQNNKMWAASQTSSIQINLWIKKKPTTSSVSSSVGPFRLSLFFYSSSVCCCYMWQKKICWCFGFLQRIPSAGICLMFLFFAARTPRSLALYFIYSFAGLWLLCCNFLSFEYLWWHQM